MSITNHLQNIGKHERSKFQDFSALQIPENHDLFQHRLWSANSSITAKIYRLL